MRHIKEFPTFTADERRDLVLKISGGISEGTYAEPEHIAKAYREKAAWVNYPCWFFLGKWTDGKGFKKIKFKTHTLYVHRASYELFVGPVPDGLLLDHQCRVRGCCQPLHLEAVTTKINIERGANINALMRNGAPPPVGAKAINPDYFGIPTHEAIFAKTDRYLAEESLRYHNTNDGPLPPCPPGFFWDEGTAGCYVLQPERNRPVYVAGTPKKEDLGYSKSRWPYAYVVAGKLGDLTDPRYTAAAPGLDPGTIVEWKTHEFGVRQPLYPKDVPQYFYTRREPVAAALPRGNGGFLSILEGLGRITRSLGRILTGR